MAKLTTIIVARKPLDGTVVDNIQKWGCGAINIDASRNTTSDKLGGGGEKRSDFQGKEGWDRPWMHDPEKQEEAAARMRERVKHAESLGRWPTNLVLGHLPGCMRVGTNKVKGDRRGATGGKVECGLAGKTGDVYQAGWRKRTDITGTAYGDAFGEETVERWECDQDCPVRDLDHQSGDRSSPWVGNTNTGKKGGVMFGGAIKNDPDISKTEFRDHGTASRYYKQIQGGGAHGEGER